MTDPYTYIKKYKSKRNQVCLVKDPNNNTYVWKWMDNIRQMQWECQNLEILYKNGVRVPRIIEMNEHVLLLEHIEGALYLEMLEELEAHAATEVEMLEHIMPLIEWLESFYQGMESYYGIRYIRNDMNLRNFIMTNQGVYGIDMELCGPGAIETDIGRMAAFVMMYDPVKTKWKEEFVQCFVKTSIERLHLQKDKIEKSYEEELAHICERRRGKNCESMVCESKEL